MRREGSIKKGVRKRTRKKRGWKKNRRKEKGLQVVSLYLLQRGKGQDTAEKGKERENAKMSPNYPLISAGGALARPLPNPLPIPHPLPLQHHSRLVGLPGKDY